MFLCQVLEHINRDKLSSREGSRQSSEFVEDTGEGQVFCLVVISCAARCRAEPRVCGGHG